VNQENFPAHIPHANSLKNILGKELELEPIMITLIKKIQSNIRDIENEKFDAIYQGYLLHLYKKGIPTTFKNEISQHLFMGIIQGVSKSGHLLVQLEDDSIVEFDVKEISLAKV
jgi:BirA family biotin operon repressor/biotin-[acetyl-CoA-carboxylase] ligase